MKSKTVYYSPAHYDIGDLSIPIKKNSNSDFKNTLLSKCPAWNHQNSKTFTYYASSYLHIQFDQINNRHYSNSLKPEEFHQCIDYSDFTLEGKSVYQIKIFFTNFYWTDDKSIWISILPHPLTSLNNNFYHCGAWFNLSNWPRVINLGAVVVDKNKPIIINRGDPLYNIKFHTSDQNENINLIKEELDHKKLERSLNKVGFIRSNHGLGFNYEEILFESSKKSKCPFKFLWNK